MVIRFCLPSKHTVGPRCASNGLPALCTEPLKAYMLRPRSRPFFTLFGLIEWALYPFIGDCHAMPAGPSWGFFEIEREGAEWWGLGLHITADSLRLSPSIG